MQRQTSLPSQQHQDDTAQLVAAHQRHPGAPWARALGLAVLATVSMAAQAQTGSSSVTLYGIVDASVGRFNGAAAGINAQNSAISKVEGGSMSTSRWGLRGNEDLGGGLQASFEMSSFIRNDTGAAGRSDAIGAPVNVAADPFFSRMAWVALSHKDFGRVRLGNVTTLMFANSIGSNAFGDGTIFAPLNLVTFVGSPLTGGTAWTNSVVYDSPNIAGFTGAAAYAASEAQGGGNRALRVAYAQGPLATSLAWQSVKKNPQTFADGTSPNNTRSWQWAGSYDFKAVKLWAHLGRIENKGTEAAPLDVSYRVWDLSATVPVGNGNILAGYASRRTSDAVGPVPATAAGGNVQRKVFTVGYDYWMSKRTDLYAMVMRDSTRTNTVGSGLLNASGTSFAVGMRHAF
ncbi:porin [Acidovorax sp. 106]|uniref:porin n=1 Tax=Acidovorax sp. 106 TaxID=2135637 RepID=UPI000EAD7451|nr:porin [Acidovorax sp. 106]RLJ39326.1 putative porin [Acidovorax sp. 106]